MSGVKAPFRYHGAKERISSWVISQFPPHQLYCEPFGGSAAVLCRKSPSYTEVYNDLFSDVVNFFRVLRNPEDAARLKELLDLTPYAEEEYREAVKSRFNGDGDGQPVEAARQFFLRCEMGFGSSGSIGSAGFSREGPAGRRVVPAFRNRIENLPAVAERFKYVAIDNDDALAVIARYDGPDTLFYVDPPYVHETRNVDSASYAHEYTNDDHARLLTALIQVKGMVVLSGYESGVYDAASLPGWQIERRCDIDQTAKVREEVLWLNTAAAARRRQQSLFEG